LSFIVIGPFFMLNFSLKVLLRKTSPERDPALRETP